MWFFVGGPSTKSAPVYRAHPLGGWTLKVPSAETARADRCRIRMRAATERTTPTTAIARRRQRGAATERDRLTTPGAAIGVAPAPVGLATSGVGEGFAMSPGSASFPDPTGAPHRGQTVAPLPCQVQHFRQTARLKSKTSRSRPALVHEEREGEDEDEQTKDQGPHAHPASAIGSCPAG